MARSVYGDRLPGRSGLVPVRSLAAVVVLVVTAVLSPATPAAAALPDGLAHVGNARQLIVVTGGGWSSTRATLRAFQRGTDRRWRQVFGAMSARTGYGGWAWASRRILWRPGSRCGAGRGGLHDRGRPMRTAAVADSRQDFRVLGVALAGSPMADPQIGRLPTAEPRRCTGPRSRCLGRWAHLSWPAPRRRGSRPPLPSAPTGAGETRRRLSRAVSRRVGCSAAARHRRRAGRSAGRRRPRSGCGRCRRTHRPRPEV